ncbi:MAG: sigma-70 family RNA polymerase sigma factor [Micavibrio sp.]
MTAKKDIAPKGSDPDHSASDSFETLLSAVGQQRDRDAFITLFNHFAPRLKSFLMKKGATPDHAEELAQETMLTVWNKAAGYDPKQAGASTWIFTIARNKRIDSLRKNNRVEFDSGDPAFVPDDISPAPDRQVIDSDRTQQVAAALDTLPPEQADLIRKAYFEDKTHHEIASETKIPLGTVKSRLRLALERLHRQLGQDLL